MQRSSRPRSIILFILRAVFTSAQGLIGLSLILLKILWQALSVWQALDFLPGRMRPLWDFIGGPWGTLLVVGFGLLFLYRAVSVRWPDSQPEVQLAAEPRSAEVTTPSDVSSSLQAPVNQRSDKDLREPRLGLSTELFQFVSRRDKDDPHTTTWIADASDAELNEYTLKTTQYLNETMDLYDQQFAGRVMSLFEVLEQRRLWNPGKLNLEQRKRIQDPGTPSDIRMIARHLSRIGHRLDESLDQLDDEEHQTGVEPSNSDTAPAGSESTSENNRNRVEDLKRRCRELAEDLRQFLEEHQGKDREEITRLYRRDLGNRNLADEASVLLEQLEEHGLYPPRGHKGYQISADHYPRSPTAINNLATILGRIGRQP